jgi:hypothetical protein
LSDDWITASGTTPEPWVRNVEAIVVTHWASVSL